MKIRRTIAAMAFVSVAGFAAAQQTEEPRSGPPALEPMEAQELQTLPKATDVIRGYVDTWIGADFTNDRLVSFDASGNVLGTSQINLGVLNLYPAAWKVYFDAVDASGQYRVGYEFGAMLNGMVLPPGFVPGGLAVAPDDTGVSISKSPPLLMWFTKNYFSSSIPETIPGQPSGAIDNCPGQNWCIGTSTGVDVLDRAWHINPLPSFTANVTAVRSCGDTVWFGGNGFINYVSNPYADFHQWQLKGFTVPFQVNDFGCWQHGAVVGTGTNGSAVFVDPANNVTRTFQLSPTSNFIKVSLSPGRFLGGYFLDSQGNLSYHTLASDIQAPADPNSTSSRLISVSLRHVF